MKLTIAISLAVLALACGSGGGGSTSADAVQTDTAPTDTAPTDVAQVEYPSSGASITLTGTLQAGKVTANLSAALVSALQDGDPLAGYKLYCVTFTDPPTAGSATADGSGAFSLTIMAGGVPFGCIVVDTADKGVAAVLFGKPGSSAETVVVPGSASLGTVVVDSSAHVAQAALPDGATLVRNTPAAAACPSGIWAGSVTTTCGTTTNTFWVARAPDGAGIVEGISSNTAIGTTGTCGTYGQAQPALTWTPSTRAFSLFATGPNGTQFGYDGTVNADCTQIDGTAWMQPLGGQKTESAMSYMRK